MKRLLMKITTALLSCVVVLSSIVPIASASNSELTYSDNAANKLCAFGLIDNSAVLNLSKPVTRAEAAYTFSKMMGYTLEIKNNQKTIDDVSESAYVNEIYQVVDAGLMSCMYDNSFRPDTAISYGDVVTAIVKLLGYSKIIAADANINEYISVYMKYIGKVSKNEKADVKWDEFIEIIDESIEANMVETTFSYNESSYSISKNKTILSEILKIEKHSGVVTATEFSGLYDNDTVKEGEIKIDNVVFECNEVFAIDLLGLPVDAWVQEASDNGKDKIIYLDKVSNDKRIKTIKSKDIENITANKIEYNTGGKTKVINLPNGIYVLFNGIAVSDYSSLSLECKQGEVYVIDYNGDGKEDVLSIFNYDKTVVKAIDSEGNVVDLHHKDRNLELDDEVKVYKNGILSSKDAINKNDVLSVLKDTDGTPLIIIVNVSTITGKVTTVATDEQNGSTHKITINGIEFSVDSTFDSLTNYDWLKANGVFFLDENGVIVGYKQSGDDYEFGYIIKVRSESFRGDVIVKLLNSSGTIEVLDIENKVTINGTRYKNFDNICTEVVNCTGKIVRYKRNSDNKISIIETAQNGDSYESADSVPEGKLRMTYSSGDSKFPYIKATDMISDKAKVGRNTIFFKIPESETEADESLYSAQLGAPMYDGENVKFDTYSLSSQQICNDVCVIYSDSNYTSQNLTESSPVGVVEDVFKSLDGDDGVKISLTVRTKDGAVTVKESEYGYFNSVTGADGTTGLAVQLGDVVRYLTDSKGKVPYLTILSRIDENGELHSYSTGGGIVDKFFFKSGYLYMRDDTQIVLVNNAADTTRDKWSILDAKSTKIVVCRNLGTSRFSVADGSIDDLNGYVEVQQMYPVSVHLIYGQPKLIVVYK